MEHIDRIALIAGNGKFPLFLAKAAKASGVDVVAVAVASEADKDIENIASRTYWVHFGEGKRLLDILSGENIKYAVMAGKITKLTLIKEAFRLDDEAKKVLSGARDNRDDTLLAAVAARLKEAGVELIDSTAFIKGMMPKKGVLTKRGPDHNEMEDVEFGFRIAKELGRLDIGQAVAVKKKAIIALEAIEGTDEMIRRAGSIAGAGTVIVKVSKLNQDMRYDVPVIGLKTIESLKEAKSSVLAIESDRVLVLEEEEVVKEADRHGIAIVAV